MLYRGGRADGAGQILCRDCQAAGGEQTDGGDLSEQGVREIGLDLVLSDRAVDTRQGIGQPRSSTSIYVLDIEQVFLPI